MKRNVLIMLVPALLLFDNCNKDVKNFNDIHFVFQFDETQVRLDNFGNPSTIPAGHAALTPNMRLMSVHYIEVSPSATTPFKSGAILYTAPETTLGGDLAIDFDSSNVAGENTDFLTLNLERIPPGTYKYIRASVAYQNYDITYNLNNIPLVGNLTGETGTVASFIGFNTYIRDLTVNTMTTSVNANKLQGFWAFETAFTGAYAPYNAIYSGQAPVGATTVVNPIDATSPIPDGSCVITGEFVDPLVIKGDETGELYIYLSFSTNQSFEWVDSNGNSQWDIDATDPESTEQVADMGLRGLVPSWEWK